MFNNWYACSLSCLLKYHSGHCNLNCDLFNSTKSCMCRLATKHPKESPDVESMQWGLYQVSILIWREVISASTPLNSYANVFLYVMPMVEIDPNFGARTSPPRNIMIAQRKWIIFVFYGMLIAVNHSNRSFLPFFYRETAGYASQMSLVFAAASLFALIFITSGFGTHARRRTAWQGITILIGLHGMFESFCCIGWRPICIAWKKVHYR